MRWGCRERERTRACPAVSLPPPRFTHQQHPPKQGDARRVPALSQLGYEGTAAAGWDGRGRRGGRGGRPIGYSAGSDASAPPARGGGGGGGRRPGQQGCGRRGGGGAHNGGCRLAARRTRTPRERRESGGGEGMRKTKNNLLCTPILLSSPLSTHTSAGAQRTRTDAAHTHEHRRTHIAP